jgi:hypothetical protein
VRFPVPGVGLAGTGVDPSYGTYPPFVSLIDAGGVADYDQARTEPRAWEVTPWVGSGTVRASVFDGGRIDGGRTGAQ